MKFLVVTFAALSLVACGDMNDAQIDQDNSIEQAARGGGGNGGGGGDTGGDCCDPATYGYVLEPGENVQIYCDDWCACTYKKRSDVAACLQNECTFIPACGL